ASVAETMAYLWDQNQALFWLEFAAPVACILIITYCLRNVLCCCKSLSFLSATEPRGNRQSLRTFDSNAERGGVPV
nr:TransFrame protein [Semliki Forest virus]